MTVWVLQNSGGGGTKWLRLDDTTIDMTSRLNDALHFARERDADAFLAYCWKKNSKREAMASLLSVERVEVSA